MDRQAPVTLALPKPGRALKTLLVVIAVLGIARAFLAQYVPGGQELLQWLECDVDRVEHFQIWRLLTSGLLTRTGPEGIMHLLFTLVGLYFLGADLERRWGAWRFVRFLGLSVVAGNLLVIAIDALMPETALPRFHPTHTFGAMAAITATAIAWSRENANVQARLFFFLPVSGRVLFWITIGFCVLDLIYPIDLPEGIVAPFGGVIIGVLLAGSPSVVRTLYLKVKLAFLRRRRGHLRVDDVLSPQPRVKTGSKRARPGAPPLRIVQGGLDDVLRNRKPPKDKRYLN